MARLFLFFQMPQAECLHLGLIEIEVVLQLHPH